MVRRNMARRKRPPTATEELFAAIPTPKCLDGFDEVIKHTLATLIFCQESGAVLREDGKILLVPSPLQIEIIRALSGRLMTKRELATHLGCQGNEFYRTGAMKELVELGVVAKRKGGGYYLPDDPPPTAIIGDV